jgi:hypothetical protein
MTSQTAAMIRDFLNGAGPTTIIDLPMLRAVFQQLLRKNPGFPQDLAKRGKPDPGISLGSRKLPSN